MKRWFVGLVFLAVAFSPAYGAEPIRFGILFDGSGGASYYSAFFVKGAGLAIEEINTGGGILGRPVELIKEDDGNDANISPLRTRTLVKRGAVGLLLSSGSASALQARVAAEEEKVPAFATSFHDKISQPPNNSYVFQAMNSGTQQLNVLVRGIKARYKQVAIFTDTSATGAGLAALYKKVLEGAGVEVIATEAVDVGDTDATAQVTRLRDKWKAKAVLVSGQAPPEQALFVRTVRDLGWDVQLFQDITGTTPSFQKLVGPKSLENLIYLEQFDPDNELAQKMLRKYNAKYPGEQMMTSVGAVWNGVYTLKKAIEMAGNTQGPALLNAIEQICGLKSHFGPPGSTVCCSKQNHLCADPGGVFLATFKNGKSVPVQK